jgi:hypothetical protein
MAAESAPEGHGRTSEARVALEARALISAAGVLTPVRKDPSAREQTALTERRLPSSHYSVDGGQSIRGLPISQ